MSGHSKWANIKRKKEATDAAKGKVFTKIGREITVCVKQGGPDPNNNAKLRDLIAKAKSNNVPNDNIDRVIKKASGEGNKNDYVSIVYEGYGPSGVAVIVECLTDNKNRTAGDIRHYFDKFGGNLGQSGCVSFMFSEKGVIVITDEYGEIDEDKLMETALEAGAADFKADDGVYIVYTEPEDVYDISDALKAAGYEVESADKEKVADTTVDLEGEDDRKFMGLLIEKLEDDDDVMNVYHNWGNCDEE